MQRSQLLLLLPSVVLLIVLGVLGFRYLEAKETNDVLIQEKQAVEVTRDELTKSLADKTTEATSLADALEREQKKNSVFERQIRDITGTVGTLQKLAEMDPELLAKYSKVYFLNENYAPSSLSPITPTDLLEPSRAFQIHSEVKPFLDDLLEEAKDDGIDLKIASAYRSFARQAELKSQYVVTYGRGANAFSAEQGYSEHQLGTTVDFTTAAVGGSFVGFDRTEAYEWLTDNAWRYGFVLSYPKGNGYYQYEPWHWRFVGKDLAERLHDDDQHFYDLDQRVIDEYLVSLFD